MCFIYEYNYFLTGNVTASCADFRDEVFFLLVLQSEIY